MEAGPDIIALNNGAKWTLQAATQRGFEWLRGHCTTGTDEREIDLEASQAREWCLLARNNGLLVSSDF